MVTTVETIRLDLHEAQQVHNRFTVRNVPKLAGHLTNPHLLKEAPAHRLQVVRQVAVVVAAVAEAVAVHQDHNFYCTYTK
jgi:hypothetical protein